MTNLIQRLRWISRGLVGAPLALIVSVVLFAPIMALAQSADTSYTFRVAYNFCSLPGCADGATPYAGLVADSQGDGFGTTVGGGSGTCNCGTIFKITQKGKETVLYSFKGGSQGAYPNAGLIFDPQGNLYGTTSAGGNRICSCGVVFRLTSSGKYNVVHVFSGMPDGWVPYAGLVRDSAGNLYGTTSAGGVVCREYQEGCGTVFKIDTAGNESVLYAFQGGADSFAPKAGLIIDNQGNLYGTTFGGGGISSPGTVFKVTPSGQETVLYTFQNGADGNGPLGALRMDAQGNLYGTTSGTESGPNQNGTVFKLSPSGEETVLWEFQGYPDGAQPAAGVIMDAEGNFYGTTSGGGGFHAGTVFKISKNGFETVLYSFYGGSDGGNPVAPLVLGANGNLYGTASTHGFSNYFPSGNVFALIK
jgi:uncharacterized repeat protein (TIGR03803 family)